MLIDRFLPTFDATSVCETFIDAPPDVVYGSIRDTDLRDPVVTALFMIRELPQRIARHLHHEPPPGEAGPVTFRSITNDGPGWTQLGEEPGVEFVVGSVGKFWRRDYGGRPVTAEQFMPFAEPGYAKLVVSLSVHAKDGGTVLRYEARTAATDEDARRRFLRYWRLISHGVDLVMRRVLRRIRAEAERRSRVESMALN